MAGFSVMDELDFEERDTGDGAREPFAVPMSTL